MATVIPVTGSFTEYSERFVDDSLAFALGWAYWYLWVTVSSMFPLNCITSLTEIGSGQRVQCHLTRNRILDRRRASMGLDSDLLGGLPGAL